MVLCEWTTPNTNIKPREWIFKGSLQIRKLFEKIVPGICEEVPMNNGRFLSPGRMGRPGRNKWRNFNLPRNMVGKKKKSSQTIVSSIDLTGDDDKQENLDFIYLKGKKHTDQPINYQIPHLDIEELKNFLEPVSHVRAVNTQPKHVCTTLCINWAPPTPGISIKDALKDIPLLLQPLVFGFKRL